MVVKLPMVQSAQGLRPDELRAGIDLLEQSASATRATLSQLVELEKRLAGSIRIMNRFYEAISKGAEDPMDNIAKLSTGSELMSPHELARELKISRVTLWRLRKEGRLPQPVHISERKLAFRRPEVVEWLAGGGATLT